MTMKPFCGETPETIYCEISRAGFSLDHAYSAARNFYRRGIHDFSKMLNLPSKLRAFLINKFSTGLYAPLNSETSADTSRKYLFRNLSGADFESVMIPEKRRLTICISCQAGCRFGCRFCLTGERGFSGNLAAGDIINQVISADPPVKLTHAVFMGMGEPLDNTGNVIQACRILTSEWGFAVSPGHITVSTVGVLPDLTIFLQESPCNITFSLFSPFADERAVHIPAERIHPSERIIKEMKQFNSSGRRRFSIAYVMISGINDTDNHLYELKRIIGGSGIRVNLIPYNVTRREDNLCPSGTATMEKFKHYLNLNGVPSSIRKPRGLDIAAACGMLAGKMNAGK